MASKKTWLALTLTSMLSLSAYAQKGETVKIAWIDPLSGLMAPVGSNQLKTLQYLARLTTGRLCNPY
jgi:branched-chain amino acid transport system substrate-binding protein